MPRSTAQLCEPTNTVLAQKYRTHECIGRSRGGLTTKIHATCDALGNPTGFHLSPGQAHDLQGADVLLETLWIRSGPAARHCLRSKSEAAGSLGEHQVEAVIPLCAFGSYPPGSCGHLAKLMAGPTPERACIKINIQLIDSPCKRLHSGCEVALKS